MVQKVFILTDANSAMYQTTRPVLCHRHRHRLLQEHQAFLSVERHQLHQVFQFHHHARHQLHQVFQLVHQERLQFQFLLLRLYL